MKYLKMRLFWISVGPTSSNWYLSKKKAERELRSRDTETKAQ